MGKKMIRTSSGEGGGEELTVVKREKTEITHSSKYLFQLGGLHDCATLNLLPLPVAMLKERFAVSHHIELHTGVRKNHYTAWVKKPKRQEIKL